MAKTVNNVKINATFTTAASREQLTSGENLCTSLGKINKYLADLDAGAFTFPANGGNADTLGKFPEASFSRNRDTISDCNNATLPGTYNATLETANIPYAGYWLISVDTGSNGAWIRQTASLSDITKPNEIYCRLFINDKWSDGWVKVNDGGNAYTLDGLHANEIASNPNLLINPDFKINQRGLTEYKGYSGYTVDMWKTIDENTEVTLTDNGLKIKRSVPIFRAQVYQNIENFAAFRGKTCTISANISELTASAATLMVIATSPNNTVHIVKDITSIGMISETFQVPNDITAMSVYLTGENGIEGADLDNYTVFQWVKLELGSVATLFTPPDPATELAKCQHYFVRLKNNHTSAYAYNGTGYIMNATTAVITLSLPAAMRIPKPTVTASGENIPCIITPSTPAKTPMTATYSSNSAMLANSISLVFTISNGIAGEPAMFLLKPGRDYIDISAEL